MLKKCIVLERVVSSAYIINLNIWLASGNSFMYIMKRSEPSMEPCGTPVVIGNMPDIMSLSTDF